MTSVSYNYSFMSTVNIYDKKEFERYIKKLRKNEKYFITQFKKQEELILTLVKKDRDRRKLLLSRLKMISSVEEEFPIIFDTKLKNPKVFHELISRGDIDEIAKSIYIMPLIKKLFSSDPLFYNIFLYYNTMKDLVVLSNSPVILTIVNKGSNNFVKSRMQELFNEGILGIIHALVRFSLDKNVKFITYAYKWVQFYTYKSNFKSIKEIRIVSGDRGILLQPESIKNSWSQLFRELHNSRIDLINEFSHLDFSTKEKTIKSLNSIIEIKKEREKLFKLACRHLPSSFLKRLSNFSTQMKARKILENIIPSIEELESEKLKNQQKIDSEIAIMRQTCDSGEDEIINSIMLERILENPEKFKVDPEILDLVKDDLSLKEASKF